MKVSLRISGVCAHIFPDFLLLVSRRIAYFKRNPKKTLIFEFFWKKAWVFEKIILLAVCNRSGTNSTG